MAAKIYDLVIIGGGPCGLACGIEAKKQGLDYLIIEKGSIAESIRKYPIQMTFFSTAENIEIGNIPLAVAGPKATRTEALQYYRRVTEYYKLHIQLYTQVIGVQKRDVFFEIITSKNTNLFTKNVVLATGYFDFPRSLNIPGEASSHVSKYYDEPFRYVHSKVALVGGGNSAVEAALDLYRHGAEVTMLLRGSDFKPTAKYWLVPDLKNRISEGKIHVKFNTEIQRIDKGKVWIREKNADRERVLPVDFVLLLLGYTSDTTMMRTIGIEVNPTDLVPKYNPDTLETNIEGVYLAGTVVCGVHTEKVFIENGRHDGRRIIQHILSKEN